MNYIPSLGRAWRRTFWASYDHLGLIIILSLIWLICTFTIILMPPATAALFYIASLIVSNKEIRIKYFFYKFPEYFIKSIMYALTIIIISSMLLLNIKFYLSHFGIIGLLLAGLTFWLFFFILLASIYIFPILVTGKGYINVLKYSVFLALNNLKFSFGFLICILIILCLEIFLPIIGIGLLAVFSQQVFLELKALYDTSIKVSEPKRSFNELLKPWNPR